MLQPFKNYELPHYTEYKMLQTFNTLKQSIALQPTEYKVGDAVIFTEDWTYPILLCENICPQVRFVKKGEKGYITHVSAGPNIAYQTPGPSVYDINIPGKGTTGMVPENVLESTIIGNEVLQAVWYGTKPSQKLIAAAIIALLIYFIAKKFKK